MTRLKAWLATARFANLPTVWSHVLAAATVSFLSYEITRKSRLEKTPEEWASFAWSVIYYRLDTFFLMCAGASLLYMGGCLLGDVLDKDFDRENRPNRPIPQGVLKVNHVFIAALSFLLIGTCLMIASVETTYPIQSLDPIHIIRQLTRILSTKTALFSLLLLGSITAYAFLHKRVPFLGLILMASCRAFLILVVACRFYPHINADSLSDDFVQTWGLRYALASAVYTIGIVLVARTESTSTIFKKGGLVTVAMVLLPCSLLLFGVMPSLALGLAGDLIFAWMGLSFVRLQKNDKAGFVSGALAGFSLLDAFAIASAFAAVRALEHTNIGDALPLWSVLSLAAGCFLLNLVLQKITPAT